MQTNTDILIVGAGPVGLILAIELKKANVDFKIIDKKPGITVTSNALGVNPRSLEIWKSIGVFEEACDIGLKIHGFDYYSDQECLQRVTAEGLTSEIGFFLGLPQSQTENLLLNRLKELGGDVLWNTELIDLQKDNDLTNSKCKDGKGDVIITSKWVMGCDGYHSKVRELANITYACHEMSLHFLMFDGIISGLGGDHDHFEINLHQNGSVVVIPTKNMTRVLFEISSDPKYKDTKSGNLEIFTDMLNERCKKYSIERIDWSSGFYIHECLAEEYVKGNIILAGDAAHAHSPAGGQGMNTGMQDAWNIAWKLIQIIRGQAASGILNTYQHERRAIAKGVLKLSGRVTRLATTNSKILQVIRDWSIKHLLSIHRISTDITNQAAQTDIHYDTSLIDATVNFIPATRTRVVLDELKWYIFVVNDKDVQLKSVDAVNISYLEQKDAWWSNAKLCLVRPDGHIAMYADEVADINKYFVKNKFSIKLI